jgi:hypothetical protein
MVVVLQRGWADHRATMGMLKIEGVDHDPIFTLENPLREGNADSRIPAGVYTCKPYSGTKFKNVYIVEGVPEREAILIHWGNTEKDTSGCILVGSGAGTMSEDPAVFNSQGGFRRFAYIIGQREFTLCIVDQFKSEGLPLA